MCAVINTQHYLMLKIAYLNLKIGGDSLAILEMNKIYIYGLKNQRKGTLEFLHKSETVEIADAKAEEYGLKRQETEKSISQFNEYVASAAQALSILDKYFPEKKRMFSKRIESDESMYSMDAEEINRVKKYIQDIVRSEKEIKTNEDSVSNISLKQLQITPYMTLDVPMNCRGTKTVRTRLGTLEGEHTAEDIITKLKDAKIGKYYFEILSATKQQTYVWFLFCADDEERFNAFLRGIGFQEPSFSLSHRTTKEKYDRLEEDKQKLLSRNEEIRHSIEGYIEYRTEIELFYDHLVMRREKYEALSHAAITDNAFIITGYIPKIKAAAIKKQLEEKFGAVVELEDCQRPEAPIAFSNNAFASPVEGITSDYSMPSADDIDPNPIMAFFYYLFFGMMFSDAGYGLLMMIACGILGFGNIMEKKKRKAYKMFFCCGVSTTFWGIMYGSFFGDMIDTIAKTFFNSPVRFKPILLNPTDKPLELLIISVAFGMVHILTGLAIKFYMTWKKGERLDAVCDTGFWIVALLGICFFAGGMAGLGVLKNIGIALAVIGFGGLLVTGGRKNKNIIGKIFGGVLSLYDITSYVGDALSYSRLMALGLATGVIASVINVLGSLGGASVVGVIAFVLISIFGHTLNFAINCLGAYVHTNRLQYVEFYQKFYEGGGRKFAPLAMNTKYYNFSGDK